MRVLVIIALSLLFSACSQAPVAPPEFPSPPASVDTQAEPEGVCGDVAYVPLATARENASLAGDFYRQAEAARTQESARESYCAASVYLRWLLDHDPTFTGTDPDDRHYRRMADAHEFFAGLPEADRRAHLDSALALREQANTLRSGMNLPLDTWASDLRTGVFYATYSDVYDDASRREFDAFDRAFRSAPDQIDDWYLRRLVELSWAFFETCESRADYLQRLAAYVDDEQLRAYVEGVARCAPPEPPLPPYVTLVEAFRAGDLSDCEPADDVRTLIGVAARYPDLVAEAGEDPDAIVETLFHCIANPETSTQALALFARSWRRGDRERAEGYFQQALELADSNLQRADFAYYRAARAYGDVQRFLTEALRFDPSHGPSLFFRARERATSIGTPRELEERAAFWCLAEEFSAVAAAGDPRVAQQARSLAQQYEDAAPTREQWIFRYRPGDTIQARSGGVRCTTRVR